jgi:hypothetical protein
VQLYVSMTYHYVPIKTHDAILCAQSITKKENWTSRRNWSQRAYLRSIALDGIDVAYLLLFIQLVE